MMRHPVVITSLAEDFRRIGLLGKRRLHEDDGDVAMSPTEFEDDVDSDPNLTLPADQEDEVPFGKEASIKPESKKRRREDFDPASIGVEKDEPAETEDDEVPPDAEVAAQEWVRSRVRKNLTQSRGRAARKPSCGCARRTENKSGDRMGALMKDVQSLLAGIRHSEKRESIRAFANVALVAEMLERAFGKFSKTLRESSLVTASRIMRSLKEDAADMAGGIDKACNQEDDDVAALDIKPIDQEDDDVTPGEQAAAAMDEPEVQAEFKQQVRKLMQGLDLYADLSGDDVPPAVPAPGSIPELEDDEVLPKEEEDDLPPEDEDDEVPSDPTLAAIESIIRKATRVRQSRKESKLGKARKLARR